MQMTQREKKNFESLLLGNALTFNMKKIRYESGYIRTPIQIKNKRTQVKNEKNKEKKLFLVEDDF